MRTISNYKEVDKFLQARDAYDLAKTRLLVLSKSQNSLGLVQTIFLAGLS